MNPGKLISRVLISILLISLTHNKVYNQVYDTYEYINTDSLKSLLDELTEEEYPGLLLEIARGYFIIEPDSCMKYAQRGYNLAIGGNDDELIAKADHTLGKAYFFKANYDLSAEYLLNAFDYYRSVRDTAKVLDLLTKDLGMTYWYSGNNDIMRDHLTMIEEQYMDWFRDTSGMIQLIPILGFGYSLIGNYERSIQLYDQFFKICEQMPVPDKMKAHFLKYQGVNYSLVGEPMKAIAYYKKSDELRLHTGQRFLYTNIAYAYYEMDSLDKALEYFRKYLDIYEDGTTHSFIGSAYYNVGRILLQKKKFKEAEKYLLKALDKFTWVYENKRTAETKEDDMSLFFMAQQSVESYREAEGLEGIAAVDYELYRLYNEQSQSSKALDHFVKYHNALIKLKDDEQVVAIRDVVEKYDAEKKEQTINLLSQEKELADLKLKQTRFIGLTLGGLLLLVLGLAILFIRMIRIRAAQKSVILEQKLLRSQMNPHFIFNALSNISNLVDKNETEKASRYLNRFARLVRHILESTREEYILLEDELKNLDNYLKIQQLRLDEKFSYSLDTDSEIDPEEVMVLPMIIQPFVENAIEHGIKSREDGGYIKIRIYRKEDVISCEIEDNGIGRDQSMRAKSLNDKHRSYGVSIVRERLAAMSRKVRQKVKLSIIDMQSDSGVPSGTKVVITMPLKVAF